MIAAFLLLLLQVAPTTPQPVPDAIQGNSNPIRVAPVDVRKDVFDYASVLAGLLLTVATFLIAIYAAIQARAAKRSANAYEQTVRLTERADVLLNRAGFDTPSLSGASRVIFTFKNFGRTRANNVRFAMSVTIPEFSDYPPNELPELLIGAGDTQEFVFMKMSIMAHQGDFREKSQRRNNAQIQRKRLIYRRFWSYAHNNLQWRA